MPLRPMLFLLAAVVAELAGVVAMKLAADQETWFSLVFMYAMIGFSFYLLSFVVEEVAMGLSYALWEAAGMTAVTLIGYLAFAEEMNAFKVAGIILLVTGVIIVKLGTPDDVGNPERAGQKHA